MTAPSLHDLNLHHGPGFGDHGSRVAELSTALGAAVGLTGDDLDRLWLAALIHDLGKTQVDPAILEKPGPLTSAEEAAVHRHPEIGYRRLEALVDTTVAEAVLCHHEHWNGGGYPHGLLGDGIPPLARIIFVADAYDVMTTGRDYRPRLDTSAAGAELSRHAGVQFDPRLVDAFAGLPRTLLAGPR